MAAGGFSEIPESVPKFPGSSSCSFLQRGSLCVFAGVAMEKSESGQSGPAWMTLPLPPLRFRHWGPPFVRSAASNPPGTALVPKKRIGGGGGREGFRPLDGSLRCLAAIQCALGSTPSAGPQPSAHLGSWRREGWGNGPLHIYILYIRSSEYTVDTMAGRGT